jgi:hypothetical protein
VRDSRNLAVPSVNYPFSIKALNLLSTETPSVMGNVPCFVAVEQGKKRPMEAMEDFDQEACFVIKSRTVTKPLKARGVVSVDALPPTQRRGFARSRDRHESTFPGSKLTVSHSSIALVQKVDHPAPAQAKDASPFMTNTVEELKIGTCPEPQSLPIDDDDLQEEQIQYTEHMGRVYRSAWL